jgi:hypothetical protein
LRRADYDTDDFLVIARVGERMSVSKQAAWKFDVQRSSLKKQRELEVSKQYQMKISYRFADLENLNDSKDINRGWENIKENVKTSAKESLGLYEWKQHEPWFDEECSKFLDQRKQAKMWQLQDPTKSNEDNVNNVRRETSGHFRNKKREYLKAKINELGTNSKNKNVRHLCSSISDFNGGSQPRTNIVKDEKGDFADLHNILPIWRNHISQLFKVHGVSDVRQTEIQAAEPLMPKPSAFEVEVAIEKLGRYKAPHTDQIPAEVIKAGGRTISSRSIFLLNLSGIRKNCQSS